MVNLLSCVLCIVHKLDINAPALGAAQHIALRQKLPMAVIMVLPKIAHITDELLQFEAQLGEFSVPLLVLVGEEQARLEGANYHLQPSFIFTDYASYMPPLFSLQQHPYKWPGLVVPLDDLAGYINTPK